MADLLGLGLIQIDPQRGAGWRAGEIRHAAAAAEDAGFEAIFCAEVNNDALAAAQLMGEATKRIKAGSWVADIYLRLPYICAKTAMLAADATDGRFILGLGVSHQPVNPSRRPRPDPVKQTPAVGIQFAEPIGLQPIGQNPKQQVAGQVRGCAPPEHCVPSGAEFPDVETAQTRDLVVERRSIRHRRIDPYACHGAQAARRRERWEPERAPPVSTIR